MGLVLLIIFGFIVWIILTMMISIVAPYLAGLFILASLFFIVYISMSDDDSKDDT